MEDRVAIYPSIDVSVSSDDVTSFHTKTTLVTIRTRVPNDEFEEIGNVVDLFKRMF